MGWGDVVRGCVCVGGERVGGEMWREGVCGEKKDVVGGGGGRCGEGVRGWW